MNLTVSFNPEYISDQLKIRSDKVIGSSRVAELFRVLKKKQIILLIDNGRHFIDKLLNELKSLETEIDQNDFSTIEIFLSSLKNNSINNEFESKIEYLESFKNFCNKLENDEYPVDYIIDDNKNNNNVFKFVSIENVNLINESLDKFSKQFYVSDNKQFRQNQSNITSFKNYKKTLFKTFWCSKNIYILAKEFFVNYFVPTKSDKNYYMNRELYHEGLDFIIEPLLQGKKYTDQKINLTIITGLSKNEIKKNFSNKRQDSDYYYMMQNDFAIQLQAKEIISNIKKKYEDRINFDLIVINWEKGDEKNRGIAHGRRIYGEYGGFITEFMPFEIFQNQYNQELKKREKLKKNTSFLWFDPISQPNWSVFGDQIFPLKK